MRHPTRPASLVATFATLGLALATPAFSADPAPAAKPQTVTVPAVIEPYEQTDLYAKTSGYVTEVKADIGDAVKAGQVLAVIDQPELEADLAEAQAGYAAKQKLLEAADAAVEQAKQALQVEKAHVARYQAEAQLQETTLKRQQELASGKAITEQQLDDARAKFEIAKADADVAQAKVLAAEADLKGAEAARAVAASQVQVAAAQFNKIKTLKKYLQIAAPYEGVVTRRMVNVGDLTVASPSSRGTPLFVVQRLDKLRVRCDIPESTAAAINKGDPVTIKLFGAGGSTLESSVARTSGSIDPSSRTMRVELDLANEDHKLLPGTYAQLTFTPAPQAAANAK